MTTVDQKANPKKSSSALKKLIITLIAMLVLTTGGISTMVQALPNFFGSTLNPIPLSPPMPMQLKQALYEYQNGVQSDLTPTSINQQRKKLNTVEAGLNLYAAVRSYTADEFNNVIVDSSSFSLSNTPNNTMSALLMYPQIRDVIPPSATISQAIIITSETFDVKPPFILEAREITSSWDPRNTLTTLPTFSSTAYSAVWDLTIGSEQDVTNRSIDVTTVVQDWFDNVNPQWGFKISLITNPYSYAKQYPPRLYVKYWLPEGSLNTQFVYGGTYYEDSVCPGVYLASRSTIINKEGVLGDNDVKTKVFAITDYSPPIRRNNQTLRWVLPGKPVNSNVSCTFQKLNAQGQSITFMQQTIWRMPKENDNKYIPFQRSTPCIIGNTTFSDGKEPPPPTIGPPRGGPRDIDGDGIPNEFDPDVDNDGLDNDVDPDIDNDGEPNETDPDPNDDGNIDNPQPKKDDDPKPKPPSYICDPETDPPISSPSPMPEPPPLDLMSPPPPKQFYPSASANSYTWNDIPTQFISFNSNPDTTLDKINTSSSGWFENWLDFGSTIRIPPSGNMSLSFGRDSSMATIYSVGPPPDTEPPKPPRIKNAQLAVCLEVLRGGNEEVDFESICPGEQDPPSDSDKDSYSEGLPYPEVIQSVDVAGSEGVNSFAASYEVNETDFSIPCHGGLNLSLTRSYSSGLAAYYTGTLSPGWVTNLDEKIEMVEEGYVKLYSASGEVYTFTPNRDATSQLATWASPPQLDAKLELVADEDNSYLKVKSEDGFVTKEYLTNGLLNKITTAFGGELLFVRNTSGKVTQITDSYSNRSISFTYDNDGRLTSTTGPDGQRNYTYEYDSSGNLKSATNPEGGKRDYSYDPPPSPSLPETPIEGTINTPLPDPAPLTGITPVYITQIEEDIKEEGYLQPGQLPKTPVIDVIDASKMKLVWSQWKSQRDRERYVEQHGWEFPGIDDKWRFIWYGELPGERNQTTAITLQESNINEPIIQPPPSEPQPDIKQKKNILRYNNIGQLEGVRDSNGYWVQFEYHNDDLKALTRMYNQEGEAVASIKYDSSMKATNMFDLLGQANHYTYTSGGKLATATDREGNITSFQWNNDETMITKVTDSLFRETIFNYDSNKNLTSMVVPYKDGNNATTQYEYDSYGYVNKVTNALGKFTTFTYNAYGEMTSTTNSLNKTTELTYNKIGCVTKIKGPSPDDYEINYTYNSNGQLLSVKNTRGYVTKYEYDYSLGLVKKKINALNQNTYYEYDTSGNLIKVKDHKGNTTKLEYDNCGRISKLTDVDGKYTETIYNKLGQISGYKDQNANLTKYKYDKLYRPIEGETPEGSKVKCEYNKEGYLTKYIDPMNRESRYEYNACYQVVKTIDALNNQSFVAYWPSGQVKMTTNPMGQIAQFDYNKLGLLTSTKDNQNNETTIEYNDMGWPTKVTDALSNYTQTEYNMYGLVTKSTNQLGKFTTFEYDANGNCTKQTSPLGRQYTWQYDELDRVKKAITPMGFISEQTYDEVGNVIELKDPLSHLQKFEYNNDYTLKKYIDQINNETAYTYDDADRVTKVTLPEQNYQQYTYDKDSNLKTVTDPLGNVATYNYNLAGELTSRNLPNPNGGTTNFSYAYDSLGRRTSFTDEAGQQTSCTYNPIGLVTQISHPNGKTISSTYDTLNRLTGVTFGGGQSFSFGYDALSRPTTSTDAIGTKTVNYDAASRITSSTSPWGEQTSIAYDDDNRVTSTTIPRGTTSIAYDQDSRPTQITLPGNDTISNTFDAASRLTHSDLPNTVDLDYTYTNHNVVTEKLYTIPDPFLLSTNEPFEVTSPQPQPPLSLFEQIGKMAFKVVGKDGKPPTLSDLLEQSRKHLEYAIANPKQSASSPSTPSRTLITTIAQFQYAYDGNRNIQARTYPSGYQSFTYDDYDRLTEAVMPNGTYTYTYNSRSNRLTMRFINTALTQDETTTYTYSVDDRMTSYTVFDNILQTTIRTASFTYDSAGNTTQRIITENGIPSTTSYTYYDDNRIHTVTLPSSEVITFTYFADGSRATKESATEWITYHYATGLVKEIHHLASNHNTTTFTLHYEPGRIIYEPYQGTPTTYYTVTDTQGTIYKLLDTSGTTVASYTYDPFGNRLTNSAPTIYNPIGFAGTYLDTETNLLYASSRYLDPTTSRFTTKDSYRGDLQSHISQNRYIYCHQNPISYSDPSGFAPIEGDNSNSTPTSTTRTKTEHKENITPPKPPENKPCDPPPGTIGYGVGGFPYGPFGLYFPKGTPFGAMPTENGQVVPCQDGSYMTMIDGKIYNIGTDGNGKRVCEQYNANGTPTNPVKKGVRTINDAEGAAVAQGITDALQNDQVYWEYICDRAGFSKSLSDFIEKNGQLDDRMFGSDTRHFIYSACVGWAAMKIIMRDPSAAGLRKALVESLKNFNNNFGQSYTLEEFLMLEGFWTTWNNSHLDSVSGWQLDMPFNTGAAKGTSSKIGIVGLTKVQSALWIFTSIGGTYNGNVSPSAGVIEYVVDKIFGNILGYIDPWGLLGDIFTSWTTGADGERIDNSAGVTIDMYNYLTNHGLAPATFNYDVSKLNVALGLGSLFLSSQLYLIDHRSATTLGDVLVATDRFLNHAGLEGDSAGIRTSTTAIIDTATNIWISGAAYDDALLFAFPYNRYKGKDGKWYSKGPAKWTIKKKYNYPVFRAGP